MLRNNKVLKYTVPFAIVLGTVAGSQFLPNNHFSGVAHANPIGQNQFMADVNGDGKADAMTFDPHTGDWWVAISSAGNKFGPPSRWISGFGVGSSKQMQADVSGDGKADLITFDKKTGDWWVAISYGTTFGPPSRWIVGHGYSSTNQLVGDINGDGKADAVVFFDHINLYCPQSAVCSGSWYAATSNIAGNHFDPPGQWFYAGLGAGSANQFLGDVDGDGKADAVIYIAQSGDWWASNSDGTRFATGPNKLASGWGVNSPSQYLADISGDGKADAVIADVPYGVNIFASLSNGSTFNACGPMNDGSWVSSCKDIRNLGSGGTNTMLADVIGEGRSRTIVFNKYDGGWSVGGSGWIIGFGVGTN